MNQLKSPYGYLVTSTDRKPSQKMNQGTRILFARDLRRLLMKYGIREALKTLDWIREVPIFAEKERKIKAMRESVLNYVKKGLSKGRYVSKREIQAKFRIDLRSYFKSMKALYQTVGVDPYSLSHARMSGQIDKEILKKRMVSYVKREAKKGNYPTYKEIQRRYRCLLTSFFPEGIRELYKLAGIPYAKKFAAKTPKEKNEMRQKIVNYIKREVQKGSYPTWRDIQNKFRINILHYFRGMREIYKASEVEIPSRKGLKRLD